MRNVDCARARRRPGASSRPNSAEDAAATASRRRIARQSIAMTEMTTFRDRPLGSARDRQRHTFYGYRPSKPWVIPGSGNDRETNGSALTGYVSVRLFRKGHGIVLAEHLTRPGELCRFWTG